MISSKNKLVLLGAAGICVFAFVVLAKNHDGSDGRMIEGQADRIVVMKQAHTLTLYRQGHTLKTGSVAIARFAILCSYGEGLRA